MLAITQSAVLSGLTSFPVRVEVQAERGIPAFELVGLAEAAVRESRVRVKSALAVVGVDISEVRVVVNLAPADLRKSGSSFDLAIALGVLVSLGRVPSTALDNVLLLGELSLSGGIQNLRGLVAHLLGAKGRGVTRALVPSANEEEAALVDDLEISLGATLVEVVEALCAGNPLRSPRPGRSSPVRSPVEDLSDVRGQPSARRALEVAASGGHNLLMVGPPGAGKTMLARRLPGILPELTREEALEVIAVHGVAGLLRHTDGVAVERPFRAPHHTVSEIALIGGGENVRPGEVSLAHHGVLFLDELAEFRRPALEALRQPLEDGHVTVSRIRATSTFPARPMLVGAMNPCPCGHSGDGTSSCGCRREVIATYRRRLSGPLLDRLDVQVALPRVDVLDLASSAGGESSAIVRRRVEEVRLLQLDRYRKREVRSTTNARLSQRDVERVCALDARARSLLAKAVKLRGLSARAYGKVLRLSRTFADCEGTTAITARHVEEAVAARVLDLPANGADFFDAVPKPDALASASVFRT